MLEHISGLIGWMKNLKCKGGLNKRIHSLSTRYQKGYFKNWTGREGGKNQWPMAEQSEDIVRLSNKIEEFKSMAEELNSASKKVGVAMNLGKTKVMTNGEKSKILIDG